MLYKIGIRNNKVEMKYILYWGNIVLNDLWLSLATHHHCAHQLTFVLRCIKDKWCF